MSNSRSEANVFVSIDGAQQAMIVGAHVSFFVIAVVLGLPNAGTENFYVYLALAGLLLARVAPLLLWRSQLGWFHPLVFGTVATFPALLRAFSGYAWGIDFHRALPEKTPRQLTELFALKTALEALGLMATYAGYAVLKTSWAPRMETGRVQRLAPRVAVVVGSSVLATVVFLLMKGGFVTYLMHLGQGRKAAIGDDQILMFPARFGVIALWLWLAVDARVVRKPAFWGLSALALPLRFFLTFSRSALVMDALIALVIYMLRAGRVVYGRVILAAVLSVYLITVLGDLRRSAWSGSLELDQTTNESLDQTLERGWSDVFVARATSNDGALAVLGRVPDKTDHIYGASYLAAFAMPVPRILWPSKPGLVGGEVGRVFYGSRGGVPPGPVGESYWNFGYLGVVLVHFIFGFALRIAANFLSLNKNNALVLVIYAGCLIHLVPTTSALVGGIAFSAVQIVIVGAFLGILLRRLSPLHRGEQLGPVL